ncbi:Rieske 2Fe-2S domain-containing protein [Acidipila sp. EB88]|uniref:Rieske 2Fe-2S domain-containing protein n=1 Tax=Acidipila sp. EB88 TaxID=2305226 RepID=UPI0035112F6B
MHTAEQTLHAVEAKCPHAGAPLVDGAVCNGRLICPWHTATYALAGDALPKAPCSSRPPCARSATTASRSKATPSWSTPPP